MKLVLLIACLVPITAPAQWRTPWTYDAADRWGTLDPDYAVCNTGNAQSPIDIRNAQTADLPALHFDYHEGPLKYLINNGATIRVNYQDATGIRNFLIVGSIRYQLTQFHFHHPSEEYVNGKPFAMAVHLMHRSSDGKVAGVTVFLRAGAPNATVQKLWDHMPLTESKELEVPGVDVNPAGLLPRATAYYRYTGSLTAPPCTEGVTWFILKTPVDISPAQIDAFAKLYPLDVRPIQPLNGRVINASK